MGLIAKALERRIMTLAELDIQMDRAVFGAPSGAGAEITADAAMTVMAVYAAVRLIAESVGSLPLHVYRRLAPRGKERAADHWLYRLLHDAPKPEQTSMEWRETMMGHLLLRGNAYSQIARDGAGRAAELWPMHPDRVRVFRDAAGRLTYRFIAPVTFRITDLAQEQVFHVRGLSANGLTGISPIGVAREALGLAIGTQSFGSRFFGNSANPSGVLEYPGRLTKEAHKRLQEDWAAQHQGLSNAQRVAILENGMKWQSVGIAMDDAQFLETRKFQVGEIARMFNVPPHMLRDLERATFSNIEQQAIEFVVYTLRPWLVRFEQRILADLVPPEEADTVFAEFLVDGLLRGSLKERYDAYHTARLDGWLSANEIRELENMNPLASAEGDT